MRTKRGTTLTDAGKVLYDNATTESFYSHIIEENKAKAADCIADVLIRKRA